jgi:hypothetical protein
LVNTTEFVNRKCKRASPLRSDSNRIALCCWKKRRWIKYKDAVIWIWFDDAWSLFTAALPRLTRFWIPRKKRKLSYQTFAGWSRRPLKRFEKIHFLARRIHFLTRIFEIEINTRKKIWIGSRLVRQSMNHRLRI